MNSTEHRPGGSLDGAPDLDMARFAVVTLPVSGLPMDPSDAVAAASWSVSCEYVMLCP